MSREFKPGDVAMAVRANDDGEFLVVRTRGDGDYWSAPRGWPASVSADAIREYRPLVVLDPDGPSANALRMHMGTALAGMSMETFRQMLREFAEPKLSEPGTWGVVEAGCVHDRRRQNWVHHPDGNWWPALDYSKIPERTPMPDDWGSLIDPVVVREGVTP